LNRRTSCSPRPDPTWIGEHRARPEEGTARLEPADIVLARKKARLDLKSADIVLDLT
jgi:hypothetical protein